MKRTLYYIVCLLFLISCASNDATLSPNATPQEKIIGTWKREDNGKREKYTTEGILVPSELNSTGCYAITADTLTWSFPAYDNISQAYPYTIEGDILTIVAPAKTIRYKRIDHDGTLTSRDRERAKVDSTTNCPKP